MSFSLRSLASTCLFLTSQLTSADYLSFEIADSDDRPTEFKDGLYTYLDVEDASDPTNVLSKFLLCTSCTISYIIGDMPEGSVPTATVNMGFPASATEKNVEVNFVEMNLSLTDEDEVEYEWTMDVGFIAESYVTAGTYGIDFKENMLGLAPMTLTGDDILDKRQFLY